MKHDSTELADGTVSQLARVFPLAGKQSVHACSVLAAHFQTVATCRTKGKHDLLSRWRIACILSPRDLPTH